MTAEFVETLQRRCILDDRSVDGEYLHAYTTVIGSQLYCEIVERRGDYERRPLADAPVRMAARVATRRGAAPSST